MSLFSLFFYHQTLHNIHYIVFIMLPNLSGSLYNLVHIMVSIICRCVCVYPSIRIQLFFFVVCSCFTSFKRFFLLFFYWFTFAGCVFVFISFDIVHYFMIKIVFQALFCCFLWFCCLVGTFFLSFVCNLCHSSYLRRSIIIVRLLMQSACVCVCVGVCVSTFHMCHDSFDL